MNQEWKRLEPSMQNNKRQITRSSNTWLSCCSIFIKIFSTTKLRNVLKLFCISNWWHLLQIKFSNASFINTLREHILTLQPLRRPTVTFTQCRRADNLPGSITLVTEDTGTTVLRVLAQRRGYHIMHSEKETHSFYKLPVKHWPRWRVWQALTRMFYCW